MTNVSSLLRIDLPRLVSVHRLQGTIRLNYAARSGTLPCYGAILGYYHHYKLGKCVEYDVEGNLVGLFTGIPMHYGMRAEITISLD